MKPGRILLLFAAVIFFIIFIGFSIQFRNACRIRWSDEFSNLNYKPVSAGEFDRLNLASGLYVTIRQGRKCTLEFGSVTDTLQPRFVNRNGTLQILQDSTGCMTDTLKCYVKITMPVLHEITAGQNNRINVDFFQTDSIKVELGDGSVFTGNSNTLKYVSFKTTGNAEIKIRTMF